MRNVGISSSAKVVLQVATNPSNLRNVAILEINLAPAKTACPGNADAKYTAAQT